MPVCWHHRGTITNDRLQPIAICAQPARYLRCVLDQPYREINTTLYITDSSHFLTPERQSQSNPFPGRGLPMRNIFIGFLFLVAIWIGWGAPVPGVVVQPLTPSDRVPTYGQAMQDQAEIARAAQAGPLPEEESQRAMRQRIIDAARRLEDFPCDKTHRQELRAATVAYVKEQMRRVRSGKDGEFVNINGRNVDASAYFNRGIGDIIEEAIFDGVIRPSDLPFGRAGAELTASLRQKGMPGRFVCEAEPRQ
jgi:hypothetical protein